MTLVRSHHLEISLRRFIVNVVIIVVSKLKRQENLLLTLNEI